MFNDLLLLTAKETKVLIFNLRFPKEGKMWVVWFAIFSTAKETKVLMIHLRFPKEGKMWVVWFAIFNRFFNGEEN